MPKRAKPRRIVLVDLIPKDLPAYVALDDSLAGRCLKAWIEADPELAPEIDVEILAPSADEDPAALARRLAKRGAFLAGFSCYVWSVDRAATLVRELKKLAPGVLVALGGPQAAG